MSLAVLVLSSRLTWLFKVILQRCLLTAILAFWLVVDFGSYALAASPVWRVSDGKRYLYLAGTIHLLTEGDYPLPEAFELAWKDADEVAFETDLAALESTAFVQKLISEGYYPPGQTLADVLSPETLSVLNAYVIKHGLAPQLLQMKPGLLSVSLTMAELQQAGMAEQGVDQHFYLRARTQRKPVIALETAEQQIEFLVSMGEGNEDAYILQTLEELDSISEDVTELKRHWRSGDLNALQAMAIDEWQDRFPAVYQQMLVERNRNWLPGIKAMMLDNDVEMVMVGALHLAGEDGLISLLIDAGFKVKQLP